MLSCRCGLVRSRSCIWHGLWRRVSSLGVVERACSLNSFTSKPVRLRLHNSSMVEHRPMNAYDLRTEHFTCTHVYLFTIHIWEVRTWKIQKLVDSQLLNFPDCIFIHRSTHHELNIFKRFWMFILNDWNLLLAEIRLRETFSFLKELCFNDFVCDIIIHFLKLISYSLGSSFDLQMFVWKMNCIDFGSWVLDCNSITCCLTSLWLALLRTVHSSILELFEI